MFVRREDEDMALRVASSCADALCLTVKFENRCDSGRGILFCQHRLDPDNAVFLPDPVRVYNKLTSAIVTHATPTTVFNQLLHKAAALDGFRRCYPDMPLLELLVDVYPPISGVDS